jgi:putative transcriptional regulator
VQDLNPPFFLVALPHMADPQFTHAVVLVGHHDENGAFGLILNQPLRDDEDQPTQMTAEVKDLAGNTLFIFSEDLFGGGPVGGSSLFALHEHASLGNEETSLGKDLFLATDPEVFQKLLEQDALRHKRRFFMGFSSWTGGQLEAEIRSGAWILVPYDRQYVFDAIQKSDEHWAEHFWRKVLLQSGVDPLTLIPQGGGNSDPGYN